MEEEQIVEYYNALVQTINNETIKMANSEFPRKDELDYIKTYIQPLNDVVFKGIYDISIFDIFVICYRTYFENEDFKINYDFFLQNKRIIEKIIKDSKGDLQYRIDDSKYPLGFAISFDDEYFDNSIFKGEKYREVFSDAAKLYYLCKNDVVHILAVLPKTKDFGGVTLKEQMVKFYDRSGIYSIISNINKYFRDLVKKNNKYFSSIEKNKNIVEKLTYQVKNKKVSLPLEIPNELFDVMNLESLMTITESVISINEAFYEFLLKEEKNVIESSNSFNCLILKESNYNIGLLSEEKINFICKYGDVDEIVKIIDYVNNLSYELIDIYSNNGIYILVNTDFETVMKIDELYKSGSISLKFIKDNPNIFFSVDVVGKTNGINNLFMTNYDYLNKFESYGQYIDDLFIFDTDVLIQNISLLEVYDLDYNKNLLSDCSNFSYVDNMIELGCIDVLKSNIGIIDEKIEWVIKRVNICKQLRINYIHNMNLDKSVITGKDFLVPDSHLDDFIINNVSDYLDSDMKNILDSSSRVNMEDFDSLDKYLIDEYTYNFDDVLISKNKYLRNIHCLLSNGYEVNDDVIFNSLIYGSILDYESINKIKDELFSKKKVKGC